MKKDILKRKIKIAVISDTHLGTYGCHAKELSNYLKSIEPEILILNGDIVDIWQFSKWYWPKSHMKVVKQIIGMATKRTKVYYITGNHDELLRKFNTMKIGNLQIVNQLQLEVDNNKVWFFHGDVFDSIIGHNKWLAKLGAVGYDSLILVNSFINAIMRLFGRKKVSLSKTIKDNVKRALSFINSFEETAANMAISKGFNTVVCGHIHKPGIRTITNEAGSITYLNSGDWIENLSALEYNKGEWSVYKYANDTFIDKLMQTEEEELTTVTLEPKAIFKNLIFEFQNLQ